MKKIILLFVMLFVLTHPVCASEATANEFIEEIVTEDASEGLHYAGIDNLSMDEILSLGPDEMFRYILELVLNNIKSPLVYFGIITAVIMISAIISGQVDGIQGILTPVSILTVFSTSLVPVISLLSETGKVLTALSDFILAFVPAYFSVMSMSGKALTGVAFSGVMIAAGELFIQTLSKVLYPLCGAYLALSVADCVGSNENYRAFSERLKSFIMWGVGLVSTLFIGLIGVQSLITSANDNLVLKTGRFFIGNFVPVIGGALSEASLTLISSMGVIKSSVGVAGIVIAVILIAPLIVKLFAFKLCCDVSCAISDFLGQGTISGILKALSGTLSILIAIVIAVLMLIVFTVSITLVTA